MDRICLIASEAQIHRSKFQSEGNGRLETKCVQNSERAVSVTADQFITIACACDLVCVLVCVCV